MHDGIDDCSIMFLEYMKINVFLSKMCFVFQSHLPICMSLVNTSTFFVSKLRLRVYSLTVGVPPEVTVGM